MKLIARILLVFIIFIALYMVRCASNKKPDLKEVVEKKLPDDEKKFVEPVQAMIAEIELVNGVQKFVYYKVDKDNEWYKEGLFGYIYNDVEMKKKVGKFKVVKIQNKISAGEIVELFFPIDPKAIVVVEVDPRKLID